MVMRVTGAMHAGIARALHTPVHTQRTQRPEATFGGLILICIGSRGGSKLDCYRNGVGCVWR